MTTTTYPAGESEATHGGAAPWTRSKEEVTLLHLSTHSSEPYGTNDHIGFLANWSLVQPSNTSWIAAAVPAPRTIADEVRELRDLIIGSTGLSRQEIARAIGVDRRSLSGYVSGEIRPTEDRLRSLREFAKIAEWTVDRFGGQARELLRGTATTTPPLDLIGEQGMALRPLLEAGARSLLATGPPSVSIESRTTRPPLYEHALSVWAEDSDPPTRVGTPRDPAVYEQDLSTAPQLPDAEERPRRRRIQ